MARIESDMKMVVDYIREHPGSSSREIFEHTLDGSKSYSTLKRILRALVASNYLVVTGNLKSSRYKISTAYLVIHEIDPDSYFQKEIDEREINRGYNHGLIRNVLNRIDLFTAGELEHLDLLQQAHQKKIEGLSDKQYREGLEKFSIDLSWKSSQIEGNTYSLLETERLLKDRETAAGKTKDEADMLLNHKEAIDFLLEYPDLKLLSLRKIEELHSILVKGLGVEKNIRRRTVSITGTNYRPLDNDFQIREAMEEMCALVNLKNNVFEKALLVLLLISYIQPFEDGNKRTARIAANGILWAKRYSPISFRTVSPADYKKAMLIFYEQNNVSAFKKIFIEQFEFAVATYF